MLVLYFSAQIVSADNRSVALFRVTKFFLGKEDSEVYLQESTGGIYWLSGRQNQWDSFPVGCWWRYWSSRDPWGRCLASYLRMVWPCWSNGQDPRECDLSHKCFRSVFPLAYKSFLRNDVQVGSPPLLQKPFLDPTLIDSFHPICNLPFLGKIVQKVIVLQLQRIRRKTYYLDPFHLGFRSGYEM